MSLEKTKRLFKEYLEEIRICEYCDSWDCFCSDKKKSNPKKCFHSKLYNNFFFEFIESVSTENNGNKAKDKR